MGPVFISITGYLYKNKGALGPFIEIELIKLYE